MPEKKATKKTTKTEVKAQKGRKVKKGENFECGICGFRLSVDDCGCIEERYLICCTKPMKRKKTKTATKKASKKTVKKTTKKK